MPGAGSNSLQSSSEYSDCSATNSGIVGTFDIGQLLITSYPLYFKALVMSDLLEPSERQPQKEQTPRGTAFSYILHTDSCDQASVAAR